MAYGRHVITVLASPISDRVVPGDFISAKKSINGDYVITKLVDQPVEVPPGMYLMGAGYTDPVTGDLYVNLEPDAKKEDPSKIAQHTKKP